MHEDTTAPTPVRNRRERKSQSNRLVWWPFFGDDWVATTRDMTRDQRGGLIDVLAFLYGSPTPGVTTEDEVRAVAGYTPEEWPAHRARFAARFKVRRDGRWIQSRVKREAEAIKRRKKSDSTNGKKGARKRWQDSGMNGPPTPSAMATRSLVTSTGTTHRNPVPVGGGSAARKYVPSRDDRASGAAQPISAVLGEVLARAAARSEGSGT